MAKSKIETNSQNSISDELLCSLYHGVLFQGSIPF